MKLHFENPHKKNIFDYADIIDLKKFIQSTVQLSGPTLQINYTDAH